MTQENDKYQESRDRWYDHNHRQEFEHDLINRKTTWGLTSQTILFAAYGVTLRSENLDKSKDLLDISNDFRKVVVFAGLGVALVTFLGVVSIYSPYFAANSTALGRISGRVMAAAHPRG